MSEKFLPDEWDRAYAAGLDAAREAVAALPYSMSIAQSDAIAAIDALKEKP